MNQHRQKQIYLFFGNQDLLVQENAEKCINDLLENRERDWCFERYDLFEMMNESYKQNESKPQKTPVETKKNTNDSEDSKKETVDDSLSLKLVDEISELSKL